MKELRRGGSDISGRGRGPSQRVKATLPYIASFTAQGQLKGDALVTVADCGVRGLGKKKEGEGAQEGEGSEVYREFYPKEFQLGWYGIQRLWTDAWL